MSQYGIVLPGFWDGNTGRQIASLGGTTAQLAAVYLMANPDTTMIGLYPLEVVVMQARMRTLKPKQIAAALEALRRAEFAEFDPGTGFVWVREMAKFRLSLHLKPLKRDDNRVEHVHRLYRGMRPNPFLGPFFDRYAKELFLKERRDYTPDPTPAGHDDSRLLRGNEAPPEGASQGASKAPSKPVTDQIRSEQIREQGSETETQDQNPRADARRAPVDFRALVEARRHLSAAAHALLEADPTLSDGDLAELVKVAAAKLGVTDYDGRNVETICAAVRGERAARRRA
jgi:hypothetical protein